MAVQLFIGNVVAVIWDFDQTLIPGYQQGPLFEEFEVSGEQFWNEVDKLEDFYRKQELVVSRDTLYLNHLLTYVKAGHFPSLSNAKLRELGSRLQLYPGLPEFLNATRQAVSSQEDFSRHGITVEHYIVSTGLRQMILGSAIAPHVDGVWACEFIEDPAAPGFLDGTQPRLALEAREISQVGYFLDNTTKTRAIWEINKGTNVDPDIGVNDLIAEEDRRVPLRNMIYIADGPSDVPVFSILNKYGGRTLGVYNPESDHHFEQVKSALSDQGRVQHFAEADYRDGTTAARWILKSLQEIATLIVRDRERALLDRVRSSARHVT